MPSRLQRVVLFTALTMLLHGPRIAAAVSKDVTCRKFIANSVRTLVYQALKAQNDCHDKRLRGLIDRATNCNDLSAPSFPAASTTSVTSAAAKLASGVATACGSGASSAATNGYTSCPSPCNASTPTISTYADVASCLTCLAKEESASAIETAYGATPPVQGGRTTAWKCQNEYLGKAMRTYAYARMKYQISCQYDVDRGKTSTVDCASADIKGSIVKARAAMLAKVAKCTDGDLTVLTSCATSISPEQTCLRTASETLTDTLFDGMYPPAASPTPGTDCAQAATFLNLTNAPGAGSSYPKPTLSVTCSTNTVTVTGNGIPPYQFVSVTPNGLSAGNYTFSFPRNPQIAASMTTIPCLGVTGVAANGLQFTGPNEAQMPDPYGDPVVNAILDECLGHTAPGGSYHYHALVQKCLVASGLVSQPWNNADPATNVRSPIIGYALDGFPVYGPYECTTAACTQVVEMLSSWDNTGHGAVGCTTSSTCAADEECATVMINGQKTNACAPKTYAWQNNTYSAKASSQYLDRCNGHVGPNGDYHYHSTETFPYINGCYRGTPMGVSSTACPTQ